MSRIRQYTWDVVDSNSWFLSEDNKGLLIDAVDNRYLYDDLGKLEELTVILTHAHFDHIVGLNYIRKIIPNVKVVSTKKCSEYIGDCRRNMSSIAMAFLAFYKGIIRDGAVVKPFVCAQSDIVIDSNYEINWYGHHVRLIPTYGHSDDGLVVLVDNEMIFTGDTLLNVPTVTRFPKGSTKRFLKEDIPMLSELDNINAVFPGHGNVGDFNEMIRCNLAYYEEW